MIQDYGCYINREMVYLIVIDTRRGYGGEQKEEARTGNADDAGV